MIGCRYLLYTFRQNKVYSRHSHDSDVWRVRRFRICSSGQARPEAFWIWTEAWAAAARRGCRTSGRKSSCRQPSTPDRSSSTWFRWMSVDFLVFNIRVFLYQKDYRYLYRVDGASLYGCVRKITHAGNSMVSWGGLPKLNMYLVYVQ